MNAMNPPRTCRSSRSCLFVPANRPERIAKAWDSGADSVIVDLEVAVAAEVKRAAREALAAALDPQRPVMLRINGLDTPWFEDDARFAARPGIDSVMLPKAAAPDDVAALRRLCGDRPVLALIETARGLADVRAIASAPGVARLVFGSIDFQLYLDIDVEEDGEALQPLRAQIVLASRLAGIAPPVDGVTTAIDDTGRISADAQRARACGFSGKLCVHPKQVAAVNAAFSPGPGQLVWARRDAPVLARAALLLGASRTRRAA